MSQLVLQIAAIGYVGQTARKDIYGTDPLPAASFRSSHRRYCMKKLFLKIWQYSQENTCVGVLNSLSCWSFPLNVVKFLRIPILKNICERLLLFF